MNSRTRAGLRTRRTSVAVDPTNPYASDIFRDIDLQGVTGDDGPSRVRSALDLANAHPAVLAAKAQATGRAQHEAIIGSAAKLVRRAVYASDPGGPS